jgi:hypothetical protein
MARTPTIRPEREKVAVCSGCGGKYPRKELIYLHEDNHDGLVFFNGGRVCKPCARRNGVDY